MIKIVVFDGGYGGETFADQLELALPVVEIIRAIDWRHAEEILKNPRHARRAAEVALQPYIGKADLIIFANYLLSITSLRYFRKKYPFQKFLGLDLTQPDTFVDRGLLILTTKAVAKTHYFKHFTAGLKQTPHTITLDTWPSQIDDGELKFETIDRTIKHCLAERSFYPQEMIVACSQFLDIEPDLRKVFRYQIKIYDGVNNVIREVSKILDIRGGMRKAK